MKVTMKLSLFSASCLGPVLLIACAAPAPSETDDGQDPNDSSGDGDTSVDPGSGGGAVIGDGDGSGGGAIGDGDGDAAVSPCGAIDPTDLLSDFESGEAKIAEIGGRSGSWYMSDDGSGTALPEKIPNTPLAAEAGGACDSAYAFHTSGTGFSGWGALVAVDLVPKLADVKQSYDASAYSGIAFRAKASGAVQVRVELSTADSMVEGGICDPEAGTGEPGRCGDHFGLNVVLSTDWKDIQIPFSQLTQKGWGLAADSFDATTVYSVRLKVEGGDYDYHVDDVHFTK